MTSPVRFERHTLGPRVHLLGRRVHEYHVGFALLACLPAVTAGSGSRTSAGTFAASATGAWLIVKDWPDLFEPTRDRASWGLGLHRLPPGEARAVATLLRDRWRGRLREARDAWRPSATRG